MSTTINIFVDGERVHAHHHHKLLLRKLGPFSEQNISGPVVMVMNVELTATQQVHASYGKPVDKKGNETSVEAGSVVWKTSDATIAQVTGVTEDPIDGLIVAGVLGVCEVWPEADADLGSGVVTIQGEKLAVHVTAGQAVGLGAPTVGTPEEQP